MGIFPYTCKIDRNNKGAMGGELSKRQGVLFDLWRFLGGLVPFKATDYS